MNAQTVTNTGTTESNPNRPTEPDYCARCGFAPCMYEASNSVERGDDRFDLCAKINSWPMTADIAAAYLISELQDMHPELTRSEIRTLLRAYL